MPRDPKTTTEELLFKLNESKEFVLYKQLLNSAYEARLLTLNRILATPQEIAQHNQIVGSLEGISKALHLVDSLVSEIEREQKKEK